MEENNEYKQVPVKAGFWQQFKSFWLQPIQLELTPYQRKVFREVHDFWNQEIRIENGNVVLRAPEENLEQVEEQEDVKVSL